MFSAFRRLKLYHKLAISFLSFALPLAVLGFFMDQSFVYDINFARMELTGNRYQQHLAPLLRDLPRYQMLQLGMEAEELGSRAELAQLRKQISATVATLRREAEHVGPKLRFTPDPAVAKRILLLGLDSLEEAWARDMRRGPDAPLSRETVTAAFALFRQLADASFLRVDPALDSSHLMEVSLWGVPNYMRRQLVLARSLEPLFQGAAGASPPTDSIRAHAQEGTTLLEATSRDHILNASKIALREDGNYYGIDPRLQQEYPRVLERFAVSAHILENQLEQFGQNDGNVSPQALEQSLAASWLHAAELYDIAVRELGVMLQQRIESYQRWRFSGAAASLAALLLALGLVLLLGRDITRPVHRLMAYARTVRAGHYDAPLPDVDAQDMAELADDIGSMVGELKHRLAYSQGILESIVAPFLVVDVHNSITFVNLAMLQLLGLEGEPEAYLGQDVLDFFNNHPKVAASLEECMVQRVCVENQQTEVPGRRGRSAVISLTLSPLYDLDDALIGACFFVFDLTDLKRHEREILNKNQEIERLAAFPRENPSPVLSADAQGAITYSNPATQEALQRLGITMAELLPPKHEEVSRLCLQSDQGRVQLEHGAAERIFEFIYSPLASMESVQIHATDITERRRMERQLLHDAFHDALTGLPNRALFLDRLSQKLARSRSGKNDVFAVMLVDIDRFKFVNDSLGHSTGDILLQELAKRIGATLGKSDTLARLGGDEFIVLLDAVATVSDTFTAAERIQQALARPVMIQDFELSATASIGIVVDSGDYDEPENLLRDADTAMFRAKAMGRARSEVFDEAMHLSARNRLSLEIDLKRALERGELEAYYQPLICLRTGRISGFEALMRWNHPERGLISPGEFIPLAEETGLIVEMGLNILEESCAQAQAWRQRYAGFAELLMSVNLSVRQFRAPSLVADVQKALETTGFPGRLLKLEVTESGIMQDMEASLQQMHGLRDLGVRLSIDDFGTGYSSLSYLPRFPFDFLKVDRSFVSNLETNEEIHTVVKTIVSLAHDMGKEIIAEGIETHAQLDILRSLSCEFGQGFLFSRPQPAGVADELLARDRTW